MSNFKSFLSLTLVDVKLVVIVSSAISMMTQATSVVFINL